VGEQRDDEVFALMLKWDHFADTIDGVDQLEDTEHLSSSIPERHRQHRLGPVAVLGVHPTIEHPGQLAVSGSMHQRVSSSVRTVPTLRDYRLRIPYAVRIFDMPFVFVGAGVGYLCLERHRVRQDFGSAALGASLWLASLLAAAHILTQPDYPISPSVDAGIAPA
jgi:hypothetical protein